MMQCPFCAHKDTRVVDSRLVGEGDQVRRRRECSACRERFTTYEKVEEITLYVIKKDGRREPYARDRTLAGLVKACEKRPISRAQLESLLDDIERTTLTDAGNEVSSRDIGEAVMTRLQKLDEVAYVRFASVYRSFGDAHQFMEELRKLLQEKPSES